MSKQKYFWQGEPIKTDFGFVVLKEKVDKPLYWYNYEVLNNIIIPAIKCTAKDGYEFLIANHHGIGAHKLINGGWPSHTHFSIPNDAKFEGKEELGPLRSYFYINVFDESAYSKHESNRTGWQRRRYPEEFQKKVELMEAFKNAKKYK